MGGDSKYSKAALRGTLLYFALSRHPQAAKSERHAIARLSHLWRDCKYSKAALCGILFTFRVVAPPKGSEKQRASDYKELGAHFGETKRCCAEVLHFVQHWCDAAGMLLNPKQDGACRHAQTQALWVSKFAFRFLVHTAGTPK